MQIRLEKDVAVAIKRLAKKEGRSVPKQVSAMLRNSLRTEAVWKLAEAEMPAVNLEYLANQIAERAASKKKS